MKSLITDWSLDKFPNGTIMPRYSQTLPLGPNTYQAFVDEVINQGAIVEAFDYDYGVASTLPPFSEISTVGDMLYVVYLNSDRAVTVLSSELEWAIHFTNEDPNKHMSQTNWQAARADFMQSFFVRTGEQKEYYSHDSLYMWACFATLGDRTN